MSQVAYKAPFPPKHTYLKQKWDKATYDLHRRKLQSITPSVDTSAPKTIGYLTVKPKKIQLEEERAMHIQRVNGILLKKITDIMETTGSTDSWNFYQKKSLSKERRQRELHRITKENEKTWLRLYQCKPNYNVKIWHEDWLKTQRVKNDISLYPKGKSNQQKKQEKTTKKWYVSDKENKVAVDQTHHETGRKAESGGTERKKETSNNKDTGKDQVTPTDSGAKPTMPEESILPDAPAEPSVTLNDTLNITPSDAVETSSSSDGSQLFKILAEADDRC